MRKSSSLHGRKSTPTPKFLGVAILSATSAQIFIFILFMPSLGFRSPWLESSRSRLSCAPGQLFRTEYHFTGHIMLIWSIGVVFVHAS